jgi:hypothetical protein
MFYPLGTKETLVGNFLLKCHHSLNESFWTWRASWDVNIDRHYFINAL